MSGKAWGRACKAAADLTAAVVVGRLLVTDRVGLALLLLAGLLIGIIGQEASRG